ncbi:hypothetical protein F4778DRAFT_343751 [Xylariomycetidae sp. FL2044]|nr:hypothetical protein F4778DRAFT_343751 [Xylariomycetidae sp. FL2044]
MDPQDDVKNFKLHVINGIDYALAAKEDRNRIFSLVASAVIRAYKAECQAEAPGEAQDHARRELAIQKRTCFFRIFLDYTARLPDIPNGHETLAELFTILALRSPRSTSGDAVFSHQGLDWAAACYWRGRFAKIGMQRTSIADADVTPLLGFNRFFLDHYVQDLLSSKALCLAFQAAVLALEFRCQNHAAEALLVDLAASWIQATGRSMYALIYGITGRLGQEQESLVYLARITRAPFLHLWDTWRCRFRHFRDRTTTPDKRVVCEKAIEVMEAIEKSRGR